jgi:hypothetical protein
LKYKVGGRKEGRIGGRARTPAKGNGGRAGKKKPKATLSPRSGFKGVQKTTHEQVNMPWRAQFRHQGKVQNFGSFATAEEAAWEHDLKRLELGYEDEGFYTYKLQLGQGRTSGNNREHT